MEMTKQWCEPAVKVINDLFCDASTIEFHPQSLWDDHHFGQLVINGRIDAVNVICDMKLARKTITFIEGTSIKIV